MDTMTQKQKLSKKKTMMALRRVVFALTIQTKLQEGITPRTKAGHSWESDFGLQWMAWHERSHCLDGGTLFKSCLPSDTRGSGSGLHTIDWIEINNQKISATCMV